jgi:hypothetical protein
VAGLPYQWWVVRNGWPILGLMAYSAEIEQNTLEASNGQLAPYGVQLTRMGNFDINLGAGFGLASAFGAQQAQAMQAAQRGAQGEASQQPPYGQQGPGPAAAPAPAAAAPQAADGAVCASCHPGRRLGVER